MSALREVLVWEFYRRNLFFFGLGLMLLFLVIRPPSLLVSAYFITGMLESAPFFGFIAGLLCLYYAKCLYETQRSIHRRENHFLYELGALPGLRLSLWMGAQLVGVFLPALLYAGVIAGHSLYVGTWHAWAIIAFHVLLLLSAAGWMTYEIRHPRERQFSRGKPLPWMKGWTDSVAHLLFSLLWEQRRVGLLVTKGLVIALLSLTFWAQAVDPMPVKGVLLIFMCLACLQAMIPYWLKEEVDGSCQWLRNFPRSRWRRFLDFGLTGLVLWLPEGIVCVGATGAWGLPLIWTGYYLFAVLAAYYLAIAALHYRKLTTEAYLKLLFGAFAVFFFAILFAIPQFLLYGFAILFSSWIFYDEYYGWQG